MTATGGEPIIGYVAAPYPAVSHTFITREVRALRALGVDVQTFSVHRTSEGDLHSPTDRDEAGRTTSLLPVSPVRLLRTHLALAGRQPRAYFGALAVALSSAPRGLRGRVWQLFYFAEAVLLYDRCRARGVRRLHAHLANVAADVAWLATEIGRRAEPSGGWSWSFTMHGPTEFFAVDRFNLRRKVEAAATVICISEFCRSQLMMLVGEGSWSKLHVAHCGVDTEEFTLLDRRDRRDRTAGREAPTTVLCVGRLTPEKGQAVLLQAVAALHSRGVDLHICFAGDGPSRAGLEAQAAELGVGPLVEFLGAVGWDQLPRLFGQADIFCLPSFAEGLPIVLMEAMACGLPVVTTPIAGIPELVTHDDNGLLVTPGRPAELGGALERLAADAELRHAFGLRGREVVEAGFELNACTTRVAALLGVDSQRPPCTAATPTHAANTQRAAR